MINTNTIEQLEQDFWGESEFDSYLVRSTHELRKKPLEEFTVENLRLMIGQQVGLKYLIPLAIKELSNNPLIGGAFYEGDLLNSVLTVPPKFWEEHLDWKKQIQQILQTIPTLPEELKNASNTWIES